MFGKKKPSSKHSGGLTYLAADCQLHGDLNIDSDCMIDGQVSGTITVKGNLTIGEQGRVDGQLNAAEVTVDGQFKGKLTCKRLSITETGVVDGEVCSDKIEIFDGGQFVGSRVRQSQQLAAEGSADFSAELSAEAI